eukprot:g10237.t1
MWMWMCEDNNGGFVQAQEWKDNLFKESDTALTDIRDMLFGQSTDGEIKASLKEATAIRLLCRGRVVFLHTTQQRASELAVEVSKYIEDVKELESVRGNIVKVLGERFPPDSPVNEAVSEWAKLLKKAVMQKYDAKAAMTRESEMSDKQLQLEASGNVYGDGSGKSTAGGSFSFLQDAKDVNKMVGDTAGGVVGVTGGSSTTGESSTTSSKSGGPAEAEAAAAAAAAGGKRMMRRWNDGNEKEQKGKDAGGGKG